MKIGIITQKLENNYGGILQNHALQTVLKQLGHEPITIDFRPGDSMFWYLVSQFRVFLLKCAGRKVCYRKYSSTKTQRSLFTESFINKYINTTKRIQMLTPIIPKIYGLEAIIVGSDQVWRLKYNVLRNTYLDFVRGDCIKIAYGASFGVSEWEYNDEQTVKCKKWISRFKDVSVREHSGIELCAKFLNTSATHVLDPTMLLDYSHYAALCKNTPQISNNPYLFAYVLDLSHEKTDIIERYARERGLKVVLLSAEDNISVSIEDWLASIMGADFVITDSFHGTVFSILFKKEFVSLVNEERGADRFYSLLNMFGLQDRACDNYTLANLLNIGNKVIDWRQIDTIRTNMRDSSLKFLIDNLNK